MTISMVVIGLCAYFPCHMREQGPKEDATCGPSAELRQFEQAHPPHKGGTSPGSHTATILSTVSSGCSRPHRNHLFSSLIYSSSTQCSVLHKSVFHKNFLLTLTKRENLQHFLPEPVPKTSLICPQKTHPKVDPFI